MSWLFTFVNPIIVGLAGSFLHRLVSHQVVVLGFTGRRSGRNFAIPVTYLRRDGEILCMTERNGIWWRNLQGAKPVQLTPDGRSVAAISQQKLRTISRLRRRSIVLLAQSHQCVLAGVGFDSDGEPNSADLVRAAEQHVLITLTLT